MISISILLPTFNNSDRLADCFQNLSYKNVEHVIVRDNDSSDDTFKVCCRIFNEKLIYTKNIFNVGAIMNHEYVVHDLKEGYGVILGDDDIPNQLYLDSIPKNLSGSDILLPNVNIPNEITDPYIRAWYASQSIPGLTASASVYRKFWPRSYSGLYPQVYFVLRAINNCNISYSAIRPITPNVELSASDRMVVQNREPDYNFAERLNLLYDFVQIDDINRDVLPKYKYEIVWTYSQLPLLVRLKALYIFFRKLKFSLKFHLKLWMFLYLVSKSIFKKEV